MSGHNPARGFTLIEVLLALAISLLLGTAMLSLLFNLGGRRTSMLRLAEEQQGAGVFLDHLESDLSAALAGDDAVGAGVKGTATELMVLSRGVVLGVAVPSSGPRALGDLQGCRYLFDRTSGTLKARRWPAGRGATESGDFEVVSNRFRRVRFRYFDGREWRSAFDSLTQGGLPVAVECAVWTGRASAGSAAPASEGAEERWGPPDRLRVIVVPDGPSAAWKESR